MLPSAPGSAVMPPLDLALHVRGWSTGIMRRDVPLRRYAVPLHAAASLDRSKEQDRLLAAGSDCGWAVSGYRRGGTPHKGRRPATASTGAVRAFPGMV